MNKLTYIFLAVASFVTLTASAQVKVGDNPTNINSSAAFEVESTNKGLLLPRLTSAQRTAIASPAVGLVVFDTNTSTIWFYSPIGWYNTANPDATTLVKGVVKLSGDLTGTADSPAVAASAITTAKLADGAVTAAKLNQMGATASQTLKWNGTAWAPAADDNTTYTAGSGITLTGTSFAANDATTTTKGIVQLAGDFTGTAAAPAVAANAVTSAKILDATVANADLAAGTGGIYKGSGSLSAGTTVALGTNVLAFTSAATTGTAHFKIDGTTFNVDAVNARVGLGTAAPAARLDVQGPRADYAAGTGANSDTPTNGIITAARGSNRYNDWPSTWYGGLSTFDVAGSSTYFNNYYTRSDRKLKTNIKTMSQEMATAYMKIRPVTYNLKNEVPGADGLQYGFIAQEVAEIFPSIVTTTTDTVNGTIGMNYQALISPTVYMVQQQQQEIERLKKEVEDLKAAVKQLLENKK